MLLTLVSVRLVNWRMIKDATFTPLAEGITGIAGRNGAGKSTFLDGALWALYGVRPKGVTTGGLRREKSKTSDECSVTVEFLLNGHRIKVVRELRGKNSTGVLNTFLDDHAATITSITPGEKWIRDHLKIDATGFMTAFVVRQKELDSLVTTDATERRATIERLSGIERMSQALKSARTEANDAKRIADALPGSEDDALAAAEIVAEHEVAVQAIEELVNDARDEGQQARTALEAARKVADDFNQSVKAVETADRDVERARGALENLERSVEDAVARLSRAQDAARGGSNDDLVAAQNLVADLRSRRDAIVKEVARKESEVQGLRYEVQSSESQIATLEEQLQGNATALSEAKSVKSPTTKDVKTATKNVAEAEGTLNQTSDALAENKSKADALNESLETLSASTDQCCPTCQTALSDPASLIDSFRVALDALRAHRPALEEARGRAQEAVSAARASLQDVERAQEAHVTAQNDIARLKSEAENITARIAVLRTKVEETKAAIERLSLVSEDGDLTGLNDQIEAAEESLVVARAAATARAEVTRAEEELSNRREALESAVEFLENVQEFAASLVVPTEDELQFAEEQLVTREQEYEDAKDHFNTVNAELKVAQERLHNSQRDLERAEKAYNAKRDALDDLSRKSAIADVLDEFRKTQIARIAPELSETATALISAMTNGKYTEVLLDDDFTPSVVNAQGDTRPVTWLSGGEVSVVALALRIAIADLITGSTGGMLWLDEILTAQDAERRASLIDTLRAREGAQIIMINHTQEASDIVDRTITVVEEDGGSTIVENS